ncbi:shugoshin 2 [Pteronotus mesoamericanus]|uniref:shugoshin 2 n=1 Tax=Pteronotus mesoamericanus TaxID=1884717 RepID=UPI0023EDB362|nr:shugoshin 2 [Pteronotus parnellii mesoamericanus]
MENPVTETGSLFTSGIKKHVKDKRMSKTAKLNVSLASKIKTKIINNSSIFKISLKHNNRALAQALSREKENSRRIATEKMLLQKEVEKLNFENTFLRLKLNNLNKKLIEIEAHMNNNLITAIEMSTLSEFHQSPFLLPPSKNKRVSKQSKSMHLPFARVPLPSNGDDDDDDDDGGKEKMQCDNNIISMISPDVPSSVSTRQSLSARCNLELLCPTENNRNVCGLDDSECTSSIVDILPKESCSYSDQNSKSPLTSETKSSQSVSHRKEKRSLSNVTKRKRHASFLESNNPSSDSPCMTDLDQQGISSPEFNWNNELNDHTNETNIKMQGNVQYPPDSSESASEPAAECMSQVQGNDDFQWQKTVYDADMDLTASEVSQIVTVSTGAKNKSNKKSNHCGIKTFRKVKDSSSDKKREIAKRHIKNSSEINVEEKIENKPDKRSVGLNGDRDSEDPNSIFKTEQLTQLNILKTITLHNDFDQSDRQSAEDSRKKKRIQVTSEQEETYSLSQSSEEFPQENKFSMGQSSLAYNKNKASRQTFVIHKLEKGHLLLNQKDKETISENLEATNIFQSAYLATKHNGNLCDFEAQNMLDLKKDVTDTQPAQQNESKINKKLRQKINRKTEIISEMDQIYGGNDKDEHSPGKCNFSIQSQKDKEITSANLEDPSEFQTPALSTKNNGNLYDYETQNILGVRKHVQNMQTACQNETKTDKKRRQKVCRRTEIISEINQIHANDDKDRHDPERGNLFSLTQKDKEIIPENLEDSNEFRVADSSTRGLWNICGYETENILGEKKSVTNMPPAKQNESKISKRFRNKGSRKTEIILEMNQINEFNNKDVHDLEKDNFFSLTPKDKESISENSEVTNEFQTACPSTKDSGNLYDYETLNNMLNLKKHVTDMQPAQQNDSKTNKLRQKVNRKTEIISEMNQIYWDNDKDMHDQESYTRDLNFKISESEQRLESQGISGYCMEINSNEKETCAQISNPYKQVKKHGKESSGKTKDILAQGKNKSVFQLTDSLQTTLSLESGLKYITNETDYDSGNQMEPHKNATLSKKRDNPFAEVIKRECEVKRINKKTSQSKKRKTFLNPSPDSHEVMQVISDLSQRISVGSEQADEGKKLEDEKIKLDFYPKAFNSLSQIYSPNIQDSSLNNIHEGSRPLHISSSKNLIMNENFALESSPAFQVRDDMQKMTGMKFKVTQRTQKSGGRTLQDLTNTTFVSNNAAKSENKSEDLSLELPSRRRKCTPLHFKEPSLRE